ncbi:MAG: hypothetical protein H6Q33_2640 [Deltaproteobacteria bacterium]|nr:hypothetical protein [Deltaproteobacteria bacterium]
MKLRGAATKAGSGALLASHYVTLKEEFRPQAARDARPGETIAVADDDLLEIEFDDGVRIWLRADDYRERFGGHPSRDAAGAEVLDVPETLEVLPNGLASRGPITWVVKALRVFGVDLSAQTAAAIAKAVDERTNETRPSLGLFRCGMDTEAFALQRFERRDAGADKPYLLFIHGTGSSTWGSFGDLWAPARKMELAALQRAYGERVLAFEHASFTQRPIENAATLAQSLPDGARLHLVTHSRGGLVGELLCRANGVPQATAGTAAVPPRLFQQDELRLFQGDAAALASLDALEQALVRRQLRVERFVRVACPALGTTLASERLDRWLSVVGTLAGKALPGTPLFDTFREVGDFFAAVLKERTDPRTLPGIEAMMPGSAFIKLVNWPTTQLGGDLTVIAGDIDPDAWWAKLLVWLTDRFYEGDHDLVVNTRSMYGGAQRTGQALADFQKGPGVNHFSYFKNQPSAAQLVRALTRAANDTEGFKPLQRPTVEIARGLAARSAEPQPVLFILPGIMGSELAVGRDRVWVDIPDLVFGGLSKLAIEAPGVTPTSLFASAYGDLVDFLVSSHRVVPFPYDWRLRLEDEADRLAITVQRELHEAQQHNQPVRFLAHSMGGLLARTMIARHGQLWRDICTHPEARLVMLGTPNRGSHAITELLVARASLLRQLAFVDLKHSVPDLLAILARYPGVLAMLPKAGREDYFSPDTWSAYAGAAGGEWVQPSKDDLQVAHTFRQLLDNTPVDAARTLYVAGCADVTLTDMYLDPQDPKEKIKFLATVRGDGRVTWDSGIPPDVPCWYMDVEHGDLAAYEDAFPALLDLLQNGRTAQLPQSPPVARAAAPPFVAPRAVDEIYPDRAALIATAMGAGSRKRRQAKRRAAPMDVRVVHGDLAFATYPVMVGHYTGDTIISAERALDRALDGQLTRRHVLGLYPGPLESCAVFVNPRLQSDRHATPKGAIVVGLGTPGALTASSLTRTVTRGLLEYVADGTEHDCFVHDRADPNTAGTPALGVSILLIGTGAGGMSVPEAVCALLRGVVQANETLSLRHQPERFCHVEVLDVWEDRAIQTVRSFEALKRDPEFDRSFVFRTGIDRVKGAKRRLSYDESPGWWHRLQILGDDDASAGSGGLRFTMMTRRARNEVRLLPTQRTLVDRFVEQAIRTTQDNRSVSRTLFELLFPNELKDAAPDEDSIVLLLDKEAAGYPWELLEDPSGTQHEPFVIQHGVLRQLQTEAFRETIRAVTERAALVIGDPQSPFVELKGAQAEAEAVAHRLEGDGRFYVETLIRPTVDDVMHALYKRPYRVLHLAGHGVYRYLPPEPPEGSAGGQSPADETAAASRRRRQPVTGMVIGDGAFLTPVEAGQMRQVPELVFINCCHLGRIEAGSTATLNVRRDFNLLAANLATEFIEMGARGVIAAGWAVDDGAATTFATTFYNCMLAGQPFGAAVKQARTETFERHGSTNTWGAYQCYGDPDYRLIHDEPAGDAVPPTPSFVSPGEVVSAVDNLTAELELMAADDCSPKLDRLGGIVRWLEENQPAWSHNGRVCAALGRAYGEAQCFDEAVRYYQQGLTGDSSGMTLKDVEQLANLMSRAAVAAWQRRSHAGQGGEAKTSRQLLAEIEASLRHLDWLRKSGETVERLSVVGSAYKRKAWISKKSEDVARALRQMREAYAKGYQLAADRPDPYPHLNWLFAVVVERWRVAKAPAKPSNVQILRRLSEVRNLLDIRLERKEGFWDSAMRVDCDLLDAIVRGTLARKADGLAARYTEARTLASRRELASVLDQIDFLTVMGAGEPEIVRGLEHISERLRRENDREHETSR